MSELTPDTGRPTEPTVAEGPATPPDGAVEVIALPHVLAEGLRVCMLVYNNCAADPRVLKEAASLIAEGHTVDVVAVLDRTTAPTEERDRIRITRIDRNPVHYRLLGHSRRARASARRALAAGRATVRPSYFSRFVRWRLAHPGLALLLAPAGLAFRLYRAVRWRALRRSKLLYRLFRLRRTVGVGAVVATADARTSRLAYRWLMRFHKPLMFLDFYGRAYRWARPRRFDVIHAHDLNTLPVAAALTRGTGARLVYDSHELYSEVGLLSPFERSVWRALEQRLIHRADNVLTVCDSIADELSSRYGITKPTVLLNCPPAATLPDERDAGPSPLRERAGLSDSQEPIILYQGGFALYRGLRVLVEAATQIERGVVVMMGWGRLEQELADLVRRHGLEHRVKLIPPATPQELLSYTRGADIGMIPYRPVGLNNTYTTPNKLFEYISVGLPIAGSRLPELERFVTGLGVGRTFEPGDPSALAATVNAMLADPEGLAAMRARALAVRERFVWEAQVDVLLDVYRRKQPVDVAGLRA